MPLSFRIVLSLLVIPLILAISLSPSQDLVLPNLANTSYPLRINANQTAFNSTQNYLVQCGHSRTPPLDTYSCENAWGKFPLFGDPGEEVEFKHRHENFGTETAYVNNETLCASLPGQKAPRIIIIVLFLPALKILSIPSPNENFHADR